MALKVIRTTFKPELQLIAICKNIQDPIQTPPVKVIYHKKITLLLLIFIVSVHDLKSSVFRWKVPPWTTCMICCKEWIRDPLLIEMRYEQQCRRFSSGWKTRKTFPSKWYVLFSCFSLDSFPSLRMSSSTSFAVLWTGDTRLLRTEYRRFLHYTLHLPSTMARICIRSSEEE